MPGSCSARTSAKDPRAKVLSKSRRQSRSGTRNELRDIAGAFADVADEAAGSPRSFTRSRRADHGGRRSPGAGRAHDRRVEVAALLHDIGRLAVTNAIWEKPGPLTAAEWEQVRLHPYHSERILAGSRVVQPLARIARMHHERLDGSGYHRGASARDQPATVRILARGFVSGDDARATAPAGAERRARREGAPKGGAAGSSMPTASPPCWRRRVRLFLLLHNGPACRTHRPRDRGSPARRSRPREPRDRTQARHLPPHCRASRPADLREARRLEPALRLPSSPWSTICSKIGRPTDAREAAARDPVPMSAIHIPRSGGNGGWSLRCGHLTAAPSGAR